jgi:hypothetical protein
VVGVKRFWDRDRFALVLLAAGVALMLIAVVRGFA